MAHGFSIATFGSTALAVSFGIGLGVGVLAAAGPGCNVQSIFTCLEDANCETHGEGGQCEANSFCTFPDPECESGRRWHDRAGNLAGECYEIEVGGSGSGGSDSSGGSGSSDDAPADDGSDVTTMPMTTADSSSGPPPDPTTGPEPGDSSSGGAGSSTGVAGTCDAQYGAAADYMLCEETVDACTFSTTTAMVMSCTDVCTTHGGTCITAHTNDMDLCTPVMETTCDDAASNDVICVCSNDG